MDDCPIELDSQNGTIFSDRWKKDVSVEDFSANDDIEVDINTMLGFKSVRHARNPNYVLTGFNLGMTVIHETGHWLGPRHVFAGGCSSEGDGIADTPAQAAPSVSCDGPPSSHDTCSAIPGFDSRLILPCEYSVLLT